MRNWHIRKNLMIQVQKCDAYEVKDEDDDDDIPFEKASESKSTDQSSSSERSPLPSFVNVKIKGLACYNVLNRYSIP